MSDWEDVTRFGPVATMPVRRQAQPHVLELVVGPGAPRQYVLDKDPLVLGRSREADLVIDSTQISRKHMSLSRLDDEVICRDLDSKNGVFLNGVRIHSAKLRHGDQIQIGDLTFLFHEGR